MQIEFDFLSPGRLHPNSDSISTADLAVILEKKYGLISGFTSYIMKNLEKRIERIVEKYFSQKSLTRKVLEINLNRDLSGWLQNEWRNYINSEKHNIKTKAAKDAQRPSFIETGEYFKSIIVKIRLI